MKISICDIHKLKENKIVESVYRRGYTGHTKIDVCEEHKEYPMGNTPEEFIEIYLKLSQKVTV